MKIKKMCKSKIYNSKYLIQNYVRTKITPSLVNRIFILNFDMKNGNFPIHRVRMLLDK